MVGNAVKAFVTTGNVIKGFKSLLLGIATQTSYWKRPESATESMKSGFKEAVEKRHQGIASTSREDSYAVRTSIMKSSMLVDLTSKIVSRNTMKTITIPPSFSMLRTNISSPGITRLDEVCKAGETSTVTGDLC